MPSRLRQRQRGKSCGSRRRWVLVVVVIVVVVIFVAGMSSNLWLLIIVQQQHQQQQQPQEQLLEHYKEEDGTHYNVALHKIQQQQPPPSLQRALDRRGNNKDSTTTTTNSSLLLLTLSQDYQGRRNDVYAAAWWQSMHRFTSMMEWVVNNTTRLEQLVKLEASCHLAVEYKHNHLPNQQSSNDDDDDDVRLTVDWLTLSVEHLSKWWKSVRYQKHNAAFETIMQRLVDYIVASLSLNESTWSFDDDSAWRETISIVAYSPLQGPRSPERAQQLDIVVTAATLASLIRQHVGRIVVVMEQGKLGYVQEQIWPFVVGWLRHGSTIKNSHNIHNHFPWQDAWQAMLLHQLQKQQSTNNLIRINNTDVILWPVDTRVRDKRGQMQTRVPRQALLSLYEAIKKQQQQQLQTESEMLGVSSAHAWKYVYYTEQDSLLHATKYAPWQREVLDQNAILLPHRWQPMPHASDFKESNHKYPNDLPDSFYVPAVHPWYTVYELYESNDHNSNNWKHCCDTGMTIRFAPQPPCNDYWYLCGLGPHAAAQGGEGGSLDHLRNFTLIRLRQGTRLTLLAASEHARTCRPSQTPCVHLVVG